MAEPIRTCVGCRSRQPKRQLVRFELNGCGRLVPALTRASGRGVYLCPRARCFQRAVRSRALARALRADIQESVDPERLAAQALRAIRERIHGLETGSPGHPLLEVLRRQAEMLETEFGMAPSDLDLGGQNRKHSEVT